MCSQASSSTQRFSTRQANGEIRSSDRMDSPETPDMDGSSNLCIDSRDPRPTRTSFPRRRTRTIDIITTLLDDEAFTQEDIAELYGFRWNSELDIRSIKSNLNLGHVRCKSPQTVHLELWTTVLGYNLIRTTAAGAALMHNKRPRQISFTSTCQYVLASWMQLSSSLIRRGEIEAYLLAMLKQIAGCEVADRPGRLEPRILKRRRHGYKLMMKPRNELRRELRKRCT